jgi:DUF971 family protein
LPGRLSFALVKPTVKSLNRKGSQDRKERHGSTIVQLGSLCDTETMAPSPDPKSVKVNITTGTGVDIEWNDGHRSHYPFRFLRDACPCALCDDERDKAGRDPGEPPKPAPGALPMFKEAARPTSAQGVGKYAIKFHWNDGHELGIYSWQFLRDVCPCEECKAARAAVKS